jgi:hypothetical protein
VVTPKYVDCAAVGKVVSVIDPTGDQVISGAQHPLSPVTRNHADLTEVRVAATARSFCADFRTSTPYGRNLRLAVLVSGQKTPALGFAPAIDQARAPVAGLYISEPTAIAGEVGLNGDWTSLVIPIADSPRGLPTGPFTFTASAEYEVYAKTGGYSISDATKVAKYP